MSTSTTPPFRTCHLSEPEPGRDKKDTTRGTKEIELEINFKVRVHSDSHGRHILEFSRVSERRLGLFFPMALNLKFAAPTLTKCPVIPPWGNGRESHRESAGRGKRQLGAPVFVLSQFLMFCKSGRSTYTGRLVAFPNSCGGRRFAINRSLLTIRWRDLGVRVRDGVQVIYSAVQ